MSKAQILRKLYAYKQNPDLIKEVSNTELADLVIIVMGAVNAIEQSIKEGVHDGYTPKPDKDYLALETAQKALNEKVREMLDKTDKTLSQASQELQERVNQAIENIRNGKDGIVSDEEIERAATYAAALIELPDFDTVVIDNLTKNANATRDGLESIVAEDDKLKIEAIGHLRKELDELRNIVGSKIIGGGIGSNAAKKLISESNTWKNTLGTSANLTVSATPPSNPQLNDLWISI